MNKVYLSPSRQSNSFGVGDFGSEEYRMNLIADIVERKLLETGEYVVYRNKENMTKQDIIKDSNNTNSDVHIAIHSYYGKGQGIITYPKVGDEKSNGFAKEIYKELYKEYYDKTKDNGLIYDEKVIEIMGVKSAAVLIQVGCHDNLKDVQWIIQNKELIGEAIVRGIIKGFKLKPC